MKESFADILAKMERTRGKKVSDKLPGWEEMEIPGALAFEQCSSTATSEYKARFVHGRVADLTGGLGVDSLAFSRTASEVLYNEMNPALCEAAGRNFARFGRVNIVTRNHLVSSKEGAWLADLRAFRPDFIYLDPARRDAAGKKVFLLEDCSPDVLSLLPALLETAPDIMVKLSPMADIAMVCSRFGGHLRELHIVGSEGECKELLCLLGRDNMDRVRIVATDLRDEFTFYPEEEAECDCTLAQEAGSMLFEPGPVLMKTGSFKLISQRFGISRLDRSTQLYFSESSDLPLGKSRKVLEILPFGKESIRKIRRDCPQADVSARNIRMTSEELRERLGVRPGSSRHIFGCSWRGESVLIVTER